MNLYGHHPFFRAYFQKIHFEMGEKATYIRGYLAFKPLNIIKNYLITFSSDFFLINQLILCLKAYFLKMMHL